MNRNIMKLYGRIDQDLKENPETYNTGLVGEALIVASYKQMTIEQLEKLRYIINRIVQKKKAYKAANEVKHENNDTARAGAGVSNNNSSLRTDSDRPKATDK